jgi:cytoskeletal protein CcmA (bactofilin family)
MIINHGRRAVAMAISGFGRTKGEELGANPRSPSSSGGSSGANLSAFIDQGSTFEGKLSFKNTVRIDGGFKGEIDSENTLIVGESGDIEATIKSPTVVVSGTVTGNIIASLKVSLHKSAQVDGDIETPCIVVEEGAVFNGRLAMGKAGAKAGSNLKPLPVVVKSVPDDPRPNRGKVD